MVTNREYPTFLMTNKEYINDAIKTQGPRDAAKRKNFSKRFIFKISPQIAAPTNILMKISKIENHVDVIILFIPSARYCSTQKGCCRVFYLLILTGNLCQKLFLDIC